MARTISTEPKRKPDNLDTDSADEELVEEFIEDEGEDEDELWEDPLEEVEDDDDDLIDAELFS